MEIWLYGMLGTKWNLETIGQVYSSNLVNPGQSTFAGTGFKNWNYQVWC